MSILRTRLVTSTSRAVCQYVVRCDNVSRSSDVGRLSSENSPHKFSTEMLLQPRHFVRSSVHLPALAARFSAGPGTSRQQNSNVWPAGNECIATGDWNESCRKGSAVFVPQGSQVPCRFTQPVRTSLGDGRHSPISQSRGSQSEGGIVMRYQCVKLMFSVGLFTMLLAGVLTATAASQQPAQEQAAKNRTPRDTCARDRGW